tara:strand:+ start:3276 stop:3533 length:258 start_codon:yes stop_codon:yes gene_type:complete
MAFEIMDEADFEAFGLVSQDDANLNKETGEFNNNNWDYEKAYIATDLTEFRRVYTDGANTIFLISLKTTATGGNDYSKYEFYKEV